jgi:hypothetical protein
MLPLGIAGSIEEVVITKDFTAGIKFVLRINKLNVAIGKSTTDRIKYKNE